MKKIVCLLLSMLLGISFTNTAFAAGYNGDVYSTITDISTLKVGNNILQIEHNKEEQSVKITDTSDGEICISHYDEENHVSLVYDEKGNLKCQVSLDSQGNIYCDGELVISFSVDPVQVLASSPWGDEWSYVYSYTYSTKLRDQISSIVAGVLGLLPSPYGLVITILYVSKQAADFLEQHPDQDYWCIAQVYVNKTYTLYRERVFVYSDSEFQNYLFSADSEPYSKVG